MKRWPISIGLPSRGCSPRSPGSRNRRIALVLITGQSIENVEDARRHALAAPLRRQIAVGACSGAELWGYSPTGSRDQRPFYTAESALTDKQKADWRAVIAQLVQEFRLLPVAPSSDRRFQAAIRRRTLARDAGRSRPADHLRVSQCLAAFGGSAPTDVSDRLGFAFEGAGLASSGRATRPDNCSKRTPSR